MASTQYDLRLKGYVGGWNFNSSDVDSVLAKCKNRRVNVLIDSTGGSLATALSISAAFREHGDVHVHFVGLNASAATIAALGAKTVTMDAGAMYLVHKCSTEFFRWASLNADQFREMVNKCNKTVADLDKIDRNVASLYASRCKKPQESLLELMKQGAWLNSAEAKEWGFVDTITDFDDEPSAVLTDSVAACFAAEGIPLPKVPAAVLDRPASSIQKFVAAVTDFFSSLTQKSEQPAALSGNSAQPEPGQISSPVESDSPNSTDNIMSNPFPNIAAVLALAAIELQNNAFSCSEDQLKLLEADLEQKKSRLEDLKAKEAELENKIKELEAKLAEAPAEQTVRVQSTGADPKADKAEPPSPFKNYCDSVNSAKKLFDSLS